jgi:hypothetical protein
VLKRKQHRLRMMIGIQRSARISDARAIGQNWP